MFHKLTDRELQVAAEVPTQHIRLWGSVSSRGRVRHSDSGTCQGGKGLVRHGRAQVQLQWQGQITFGREGG